MTGESMWLPRSRCGRHCLPRPGTWPVADRARRISRLVGVALLLAVGLAAAAPLLLARGATRQRAARLFARALLRSLGIAHDVRGQVPRRAALVVANHVSWLDVLLLMAHLPVRLVAKQELRRWPIVGALAAASGTLFINRNSPRALPAVVADVAAALRAGSVVALFPEATTFCGGDTGSFRPAMFQAAIDARAVVAPVSLRYGLASGDCTTVAAFVGDDGLFSSLVRVASVQGLTATLRMHAVLHPEAAVSRRVLARAAHATVSPDAPAGRQPWRGDRSTAVSTGWRRVPQHLHNVTR